VTVTEEELKVVHLEISCESFFAENAGHHRALLLLENANFFLNAVTHEEAVGIHLALLSNTVASVDRLIFNRRVPPGIVKNDVACRGQVETTSAGFEGKKENLGLFRFLEVTDNFVAVLRLGGEVAVGLNPLLPRPKGAKDAEGMKSKFLAVCGRLNRPNSEVAGR